MTVLFRAAVLVALLSCRPVEEPPQRAGARAAVLAMAEGVKVGDAVCASTARRLILVHADEGRALAIACAATVKTARESLLATETALDAGDVERAGCAVRPAVDAFERLAGHLRGAKAELSPPVEDGLVMASTLARTVPCNDGGAP